MNNQFITARELIIKARESLRRGDKATARQLGEQAALLAPDMEDAWLVLAASDPDPGEALTYARKALELQPHSTRAQRAVEWAEGRVSPAQVSTEPQPGAPTSGPSPAAVATPLPQNHAYQTVIAAPQSKPGGRRWLLPALLAGGACVLLGLFAFFALTSPVIASLVNSFTTTRQENLWAPVEIAKPELDPVEESSFAVAPAETATAVPTEAPATPSPTDPPTFEPTEAPTEAPVLEEPTPAPTGTPGEMVMEVVADTPTNEYIPPQDQIASVGNGVRWIDVDLTNQRLYAYEGDVVVNSFIVSTGTWRTPTVTGKYKIYVKVRMQDMRGPGYHLRDVPYVMFFYGDYGLHGTYWHNNFGTPMSRGCVNLTIDDAAWLFNWASVGTVVNVHY
ncbi:MAG: L,D-transpeptidase family protein [Chloroflexota bacterium]|nr:L,D-transpeptidase family protein [Chloroflexota bacterium]